MKRILSITTSSLISLLTVLFIALLSPAPAHGQSACAQLGVDCSHPTTTQRPPREEREERSETRNSNGDTSSQISTYNHNVKQIRKAYKLGAKGEAAKQQEKWSDAAKYFDDIVKNLPTNFDGGVGSDKQAREVGELKAAFWAQHAYAIYRMGQLELAAAQFRWVVENRANARPIDVDWARKTIASIEEELYQIAMEKKRQEALKLHNSDFRP